MEVDTIAMKIGNPKEKNLKYKNEVVSLWREGMDSRAGDSDAPYVWREGGSLNKIIE